MVQAQSAPVRRPMRSHDAAATKAANKCRATPARGEDDLEAQRLTSPTPTPASTAVAETKWKRKPET